MKVPENESSMELSSLGTKVPATDLHNPEILSGIGGHLVYKSTVFGQEKLPDEKLSNSNHERFCYKPYDA